MTNRKEIGLGTNVSSLDMRIYEIVVVPHSHWDREWYNTFEQFRFYLVRFMDDMIDVLERDIQFHTFLLDGQVK
jgi:mannosylglycerate hydrolase